MLNRLPDSRWNYDAAAHLLNRAGFSGPPAEIEKLAALGLDNAISRLVDYDRIADATSAPEWAKPDPTRIERMRQMRALPELQRREMEKLYRREEGRRLIELRDWWLRRMATGPRPLQEKMTLFWHGHFATSFEKVRNAYLMWLQNETFRQNAMGSWQKMLMDVSKDPAMLIWLDNARSSKNRPNENYAREVMELFTLGEGHYTETDIKEAARAFTGWGLSRDRQSFADISANHDPGDKVFLGARGKFAGDDVIRQITNQAQTNLFITAKLWNFFAGEKPEPALNQALASEFTSANQQFRPFMRTLLSSEEFYAPRVRHIQIKSPVQWLVGSVRLLERDLPPAVLNTTMLRSLGQDLFNPPNVKGWDGGIAWITTSNLLRRYNYAASLIEGTAPIGATTGARMEKMMDRLSDEAAKNMPPAAVATLFPSGDLSSVPKTVAALQTRFIQGPIKEQRLQSLRDYLQTLPAVNESSLRQAVRLVMSTPDYQLT